MLERRGPLPMTKRKNRQQKLHRCGRGEERTIVNDQTEEQSEEIAQMWERRGPYPMIKRKNRQKKLHKCGGGVDHNQ